ncbi:MAG TPA: TetR/AcrR family transcriptional regulator [Rhizomicrobium sp.]|nr:TetR/AcrR family transcriptional regulator [Rhizomicrobium sp.]
MPKARKTATKIAAERWSLPATQARSRATRERLMAAAERVFAEKGYDGARLADIADAAGCSVGAVYFRFKDKDALFFAIAESFAEEARAGLARLLEGTTQDDPETVIHAFVEATAGNFRRHKGLFRAIVECGFEHPQTMNAIMTFRDELAAALEKALKSPGLRVRVMTQMIYGFMLVGVLNSRAPTRIHDNRAIGELAAACIAYFRGGAR